MMGDWKKLCSQKRAEVYINGGDMGEAVIINLSKVKAGGRTSPGDAEWEKLRP